MNANSHTNPDHSEALQISLLTKTATAWTDKVMDQFDDFLVDHAACERKAAAVATSMICHYPDKKQLVAEMADLAVEEMSHYREVIKLIHQREVSLTADSKDPYVNQLRDVIRHGRQEYFQDRLIIAGIVEARGTERFRMLAKALSEPALRRFYTQLADSEERHQNTFLQLALHYCPAPAIAERLAELQLIEAEIVDGLEIRAALH